MPGPLHPTGGTSQGFFCEVGPGCEIVGEDDRPFLHRASAVGAEPFGLHTGGKGVHAVSGELDDEVASHIHGEDRPSDSQRVGAEPSRWGFSGQGDTFGPDKVLSEIGELPISVASGP